MVEEFGLISDDLKVKVHILVFFWLPRSHFVSVDFSVISFPVLREVLGQKLDVILQFANCRIERVFFSWALIVLCGACRSF